MERLRNFFLSAIALQLLMSVAALPFLLWWHIPYPLLSVVGNLLHPLFLTTFLLLASFLFFAVLFGLPHETGATLLNTATDIWDHFLKTPAPSGWIALSWWHLVLSTSVLLLCGIFIIPQLRWHWAQKMSTCLLALSIIASLWRLNTSEIQPLTILRKGERTVLFLPHPDKTLDIVDHGYIRGSRDTRALLHYDILPHILFNYGQPKDIKMYGYGTRIAQARKAIATFGLSLPPTT